MEREFKQKPKVVATGGLAALIAEETETISLVNPLLTLEGLRLIYAKIISKISMVEKGYSLRL